MRKRRNKIAYLLTMALVVSCVFSSAGSTYGRLIQRASSELLFRPVVHQEYFSDCLREGGQRISLSDWQADEYTRTVVFEITRPMVDTQDDLDAEVAITLIDVTSEHFSCSTEVGQDTITVIIERIGQQLEFATEMSIHIEWFSLEGTVVFNALPYGDVVEEGGQVVDRPVVPNLNLVSYNDAVDSRDLTVCLKLNLDTYADFTFSFLFGDKAIERVRWSFDGVNYTLLYDQGSLEIKCPYVENWDGTIFFDFSDSLEPGQRPTVVLEATGYDRREICPTISSRPELPDMVVRLDSMPYVIKTNPRWGQAQLEIVEIQRLILDEQGHISFIAVETLTADVQTDGVHLGVDSSGTVEPGTYRILYSWVWNETVVSGGVMNIFVNSN